MTTKVVVENLGPNNIVVDDKSNTKIIHPGEKTSEYVYGSKTLTVFELDPNDANEP